MDPASTQPPQTNGWGPEVEDDVNSVDENPEDTNRIDPVGGVPGNARRDHEHGSGADCPSVDCSKRRISLLRENKKLKNKIQKLNKELRKSREQPEQKNDGAAKRTKREWPEKLREHQGDDTEYPGIYKLSCYEENMNPKTLHPALEFKGPSPALVHRDARICFEEAQREAQNADSLKYLVFNPRKPMRFLEYRSKYSFHDLPKHTKGEIFKHLFSYPDKLIHAISRLDEFVEPETIPLNEEKKKSGLLNRFHITGKYSGHRCSLTYAVKGNDLLAPLLVSRQFLFLGLHAFFGCNTFAFSSLGKLGRFSRGIGPARRQRLQHIELLWIGSQTITMEGHSRRTWALASICEMARLRSLTIYIDESHLRRKHEDINYMSYLAKKTSGQPNFRMARNLRTLQGIDYVRQVRGLRVLRVLDNRSCEPVRDWSFVLDLETSCKRDKPYNQHQKSKLQKLLPLSAGKFTPSTWEWETAESYYDTDWNPARVLEDDEPDHLVHAENTAVNFNQTSRRTMSVANPTDSGSSTHGRAEDPTRVDDDDADSDANTPGNRGHTNLAAPVADAHRNTSPARLPTMDMGDVTIGPNSNEGSQSVQDMPARMSPEPSPDTSLEYGSPILRGPSHTPEQERQVKSPLAEEGLFVGPDPELDEETKSEPREEDRESTPGNFDLRPSRGMKRPPSQGLKRPPTHGMKRPLCHGNIGENPENNTETNEGDSNGPGGEVIEPVGNEDMGDEGMQSDPGSDEETKSGSGEDDRESTPGIFESRPSQGMKRPPTYGMKRPPSRGFKRPPSKGMKRLPGQSTIGEDPNNDDERDESDSDGTGDDETESLENEDLGEDNGPGEEVVEVVENEDLGDSNGPGDEVMESIEKEDVDDGNMDAMEVDTEDRESVENEDVGDGNLDAMEVDSEEKLDDTAHGDIPDNNEESPTNMSFTGPEGGRNTKDRLGAMSSLPGEQVDGSASGPLERDSRSDSSDEGTSETEPEGDSGTITPETEPNDTPPNPSDAREAIMPPSNAQKRQGQELVSERGKKARQDGTE